MVQTWGSWGGRYGAHSDLEVQHIKAKQMLTGRERGRKRCWQTMKLGKLGHGKGLQNIPAFLFVGALLAAAGGARLGNPQLPPAHD